MNSQTCLSMACQRGKRCSEAKSRAHVDWREPAVLLTRIATLSMLPLFLILPSLLTTPGFPSKTKLLSGPFVEAFSHLFQCLLCWIHFPPVPLTSP